MRHFLLTILLILSTGTMNFGKKFNLQYQWKYADLLWESPQQKQKAIDSGAYNPSAFPMYDVDRAPDGRVFITATKEKGVPVSLMTVTDQYGGGGPLLRPYPDWTWYKDDCEGITGDVYQVDIKCNHLFVVDNGRLFDKLCPLQLLIFDLSTDKLVKRVNIPNKFVKNKTKDEMLISCFVYAPDCKNMMNDTIVFIADAIDSSLMIYNTRTSKFRIIKSDFMKATNTDIIIENKSYPTFSYGITGLTIIDKNLYYAAFLGNKIYKIEYSKLMDYSMNDINDYANQHTKLVGALGGQTAMLTSDRCAIFFNDITNSTVMCADATKEIHSKNKEIIAYDSKQLQFVSGMKIRHGDIMILSNTIYQHLNNPFNISEINFRIFSMPITEIEKNTNCFSSCPH